MCARRAPPLAPLAEVRAAVAAAARGRSGGRQEAVARPRPSLVPPARPPGPDPDPDSSDWPARLAVAPPRPRHLLRERRRRPSAGPAMTDFKLGIVRLGRVAGKVSGAGLGLRSGRGSGALGRRPGRRWE